MSNMFGKDLLDVQAGIDICNYLLRSQLWNLLLHTADTLMLVHPDNTNFRIARAEALKGLGRYEEAFEMYDSTSELPSFTDSDLSLTISKMNEVTEIIKNKYVDYPHHIVTRLTDAPEPSNGLITFTITTCKRMDLFVPTMNSFLNCCTDLHLISEWICVDDNSSEEDRKRMQKMYPFFRFIFKTPEEKGHPRSMNILRKEVKTPFIFHMEDDWKFVAKKPYITMCLNVLSANPKYSQCLVNRNFSETTSCKCSGGFLRKTSTGLRYVEHQYIPDKAEHDAFMARNGRSVAYWPHYSFRPSLLRKAVWDLQPFVETPCHFEMVHAYAALKHGWISTFLPGTYSLHTGKLTSEKASDKPNAYALNQTSQFGTTTPPSVELDRSKWPEVITKMECIPRPFRYMLSRQAIEKIRSVKVPLSSDMRTQSYCINMDRRPDRIEKFNKFFKGVQRFTATDGDSLSMTPLWVRMFGVNNTNWNRGMLGCGLSHMRLWEQLLKSDSDVYLVFEDDTEPTQYSHLINTFYDKDKAPKDYDVIFFAYHEKHHNWAKPAGNEPPTEDNLKLVNIPSFGQVINDMFGSGAGYAITRQGAARMLTMINSSGMINAIDTLMERLCDAGGVFFCADALARSPLANFDGSIDSDIQPGASMLRTPIRNVENFIPKHLQYLMELTEKHGFKLALKTEPAVADQRNDTVYVYETTEEKAAEVPLAPHMFMYWITFCMVVLVPEKLQAIIEKEEGWMLSQDGVLDLSRLLRA